MFVSVLKIIGRVLLVPAAVLGFAMVGLGVSALWGFFTCGGVYACIGFGQLFYVGIGFILVGIPFSAAAVPVVLFLWAKRFAWLITWPTLFLFVGALLVGVGILIGTMVLSDDTAGPTEAALRQRAEAASEAASSVSLRDHPFDAWVDVYRFMTPEFQKKCRSGRYESMPDNHLTFMRAQALGRRDLDWNLVSDYVRHLAFQVTNVTIVRTGGLVELEVLYKGEPAGLGGDHEQQQWVFNDGQWWIKSSIYWMTQEMRESGRC